MLGARRHPGTGMPDTRSRKIEHKEKRKEPLELRFLIVKSPAHISPFPVPQLLLSTEMICQTGFCRLGSPFAHFYQRLDLIYRGQLRATPKTKCGFWGVVRGQKYKDRGFFVARMDQLHSVCLFGGFCF